MGLAGLSAGPEWRAEANWVGPPGSAQLDRKCCFLKYFPVQRYIQKYLDKSIKPRKIPEKFQKFQENSKARLRHEQFKQSIWSSKKYFRAF
jgi:hypothetical protein